MTKLYASISSDLVNPDLEAKIDEEVVVEPHFEDIPTNLYAAITSNVETTETNVEPTEPTGRQFAYSVPNRLYTLLIPEKPDILAEERIFVYVPKVTYNSAGIAKFALTQFNVINGEVSLNSNYLTKLVLANLLKVELMLIVTELPTTGEENKIYLVPINSSICNGYVWNIATQTWLSLGTVSLNLANYYTKTEIDNILYGTELNLANYYTKAEVLDLLNNMPTGVQIFGDEPDEDILWLVLEP